MTQNVNLDSLNYLLPEQNVKRDDPATTKEMDEIDIEFSSLYNERVEILRSYLVLAESTVDLQDANFRRVVFPKLSYGMRKAGEYLGWAKYHHRKAYIDRKQAEATAALDTFGRWLAVKKAAGEDVKVTDATRTHYININEEVIKAANKEAYMEAVVEQLSTMKAEFMMAISTIKAMAYGVREESYMSGASTAVNSQQ